jgi:hypothetical protein
VSLSIITNDDLALKGIIVDVAGKFPSKPSMSLTIVPPDAIQVAVAPIQKKGVRICPSFKTDEKEDVEAIGANIGELLLPPHVIVELATTTSLPP